MLTLPEVFVAKASRTKRSRTRQLPEMVLTPEAVDKCLRTAADTVREVERQLERYFLLPPDAVALRIQ